MNSHADRQKLLSRLSQAEEAHRKATYAIKDAMMDKLRIEAEILKINAMLAE